MRLGRLAGDAYGRREPRHALGLRHGDLKRHNAFGRMPARQLAAARNDGGGPAKPIPPRADQGVNHRQAGADQRDRFRLHQPLRADDLIRRERAACRSVLHAISGGQHDNIGAQRFRFPRTNGELTAATAARNSRIVDDPGIDVGSAFNGLEQTLPHIGAEQLPRQKAVGETFVQAGIVFALIDLRKRPVQKILGAIRQNREVARSHVRRCNG